MSIRTGMIEHLTNASLITALELRTDRNFRDPEPGSKHFVRSTKSYADLNTDYGS